MAGRDDYDYRPPAWEDEERERSAADEWEAMRSADPRDDIEFHKDRPERGGRVNGRVNGLVIALIAVLALGTVFAAWQLGKILLNYRRDRAAFSDLASSAVTVTEERLPSVTVVTETEEEAPARVEVSRVPIAVDWDFLRAQNGDIVGWLYCPGTIINYPVVQTADNDYYLHRGFDGQPNTSGTLFADKDSVEGVVQSNYIIYGHNMKDDSMFGTFQEYMDESYLEANPVLYYLTPDGAYLVELFALHIVEGTVDNFPTFFQSAEDYQGYIDRISPGFFWFKKELQNTDYQLMTLSTCTSAAGIEEARLVLHGVMVPIE